MMGHVSRRYPFLKAGELPDFLIAVDGYTGSRLAQLVLKILMLSGLRTVELRTNKWSYVDFNTSVLSIPADVMKMGRPHLVPLSMQLSKLLRELHTFSGQFDNMFFGRNDPSHVMSENTINQMIAAIGYKGRVVGHGFRHTMSTILNDQGYPADWIELQLAHVDKNLIRGTYNHALYLEGRKEILQWYANYIDGLRFCISRDLI